MDSYIITKFQSFIKSVSPINESRSDIVVQGKGTDPWEYKKSGDSYFTRKKGTDDWIETSGAIRKNIKDKVFGKISSKTDKTLDHSKSSSFPIKNRKDGDKFRAWVNSKYPKVAKSLDLDRSGSYNNSYIKKAWAYEIKPGITLGSIATKAVKLDPSISSSSIEISDTANSELLNKMNFGNINTGSSSLMCRIDNRECAGFVNDYSDKIDYVGDAWHAHNNDSLGKRIWTSFHNLNPSIIKKINDLWKKIHENGGGKKNGKYNQTASKLVDSIVPKSFPSNIKLKINDVVGIYYPPSKNHEKAFYRGGAPSSIEGGNERGYFINKNNPSTPLKIGDEPKEGNTISSGNAWGMNTHVGIVGAIKESTPIIFHNVDGSVYADPIGKIKGGGRIAWVRRPGADSKILLQ